MERREYIEAGKAVLGIELGSTRIKAVLIDDRYQVLATGSYDWENQYIDGIWTYSLEEIWKGIQGCYRSLRENVQNQYQINLQKIASLGISAMMHGYMVFDKEGRQLVPFRTWRNTMTLEASRILGEVFSFHIPQRWSIAHLYQAILNQEEHVKQIDFLATLEAYIHWSLSGERVLGIGDAAGMFPVDMQTKTYYKRMLQAFDDLVKEHHFPWKVEEILPRVMVAGEDAGYLTRQGALLLDPSGNLQAGVPMCPPEGDAGTGMVATNSIRKKGGNISAGTSIFGMVVLEKDLSKPYEELDIVMTPSGSPVAMVHCNNGTSEINSWVNLFREFYEAMGGSSDINQIFKVLYEKALEGDEDCGGLLSYGYLSGEHITGLEEGRPLFIRKPDSRFNLGNFMRNHLLSTMATMRIGFDILEQEGVEIEEVLGHGGLFKTKTVGQTLLAAALGVPVTVMETAGEGGPWGMAILAAYRLDSKGMRLEEFLEKEIFEYVARERVEPAKEDMEGFATYQKAYRQGLAIEKAGVEYFR